MGCERGVLFYNETVLGRSYPTYKLSEIMCYVYQQQIWKINAHNWLWLGFNLEDWSSPKLIQFLIGNVGFYSF